MTVIKIENLWKQYRLGIIGHGTLQADIQSWWAGKWGREDPNAKIAAMYKGQEKQVEGDRFWALRDINLEVQQGEIVGIIGKNGAGKSTLLKILSRVTAPSRGEVKVKGRIASLLEVGTGFHPELTGRENIFLNGAILGMTKPEIRSKFHEILHFSGVEQFIDTPVKRYSSGMYVRLAFAVAAHLDPEILVVDEVLAVGDAEFQRKCVDKMKDVSKQGRTVLFVSHNMMAIRNLCERTLLIDQGRIAMDSDTEPVVSKYLNRNLIDGAVASRDEIEQKMDGAYNRNNRYVRIHQISLLDEKGVTKKIFDSDEALIVCIHFECLQLVRDLHIRVYIVDESNREIVASQTSDDINVAPKFVRLEPGRYKARCTFPKNFFGGKTAYLTVHVQYPKIEHIVINRILEFETRFRGFNKDEQVVRGGSKVYVWPKLNWTVGVCTENGVNNGGQ